MNVLNAPGSELERLINQSRFITLKIENNCCRILYHHTEGFFELLYDRTRGKAAGIRKLGTSDTDVYLDDISITEAAVALNGGGKSPE